MENGGNVFGITWPTFLAQLILFIIVYLILRRYAFAPVVTMLEERRRRIEEGQINSEKIKKQLGEAETRYQEILSKANAEAQRLINEVKASGQRLAEQKRQEAMSEAEQITKKAQEQIALERQRTMAELKREVGRLVVETTGKVTGKVLTEEDQHRINEETAHELAS